MKNKKEIWLNLGCGVSLADNFINVDNFMSLKDLKEGARTKKGMFCNARIPKGAKFVKGDMCALPFEDNYADYIECNDAIEHMPQTSVHTALTEMYRVLKPGGKLGLSTTNFDELARLWTQDVTGNPLNTPKDFEKYQTLANVIYGHQASLGEYHKVPFNPYLIGYHLQSAGFKLENITITIHPTNSPYVVHAKAYAHMHEKLKESIFLTEMMWVDVIK